MTISERLKSRRREMGITQDELSRLSGVSQAQISRLEGGFNEPTAYVVAQLALVLGVSTDWLLGLDENKPISEGEDLSDPEAQLVRLYRSKSPEDQQKLLEIARLL